MAKKYTKNDISFVRQSLGKMTVKQMADKLGHSQASLQSRIWAWRKAGILPSAKETAKLREVSSQHRKQYRKVLQSTKPVSKNVEKSVDNLARKEAKLSLDFQTMYEEEKKKMGERVSPPY